MEGVGAWKKAILDLDACEIEVSHWEADFLAGNISRMNHPGFRLSERQKRVIVRMAEDYLGPHYAAELLGQQVVF